MANWLYFEVLKYEKEEDEEGEQKDEENEDDNDDINIREKNKEEEAFSILGIFKKFYSSDVQILM